MNHIIKTIVFSFALFTVTSGFTQVIQLEDLYERYVQEDYSTINLPEYNQEIEFEAMIVGQDQNFKDGIVYGLSSPTDPSTTIARFAADDETEISFQKIKNGEKILAKCVLGFSSGTDYMTLTQCELNE